MNGKPIFKYFTGKEVDAFIFYRIPKLLFTNDYFKKLSTEAKVLYGLMLDRMSLSVKNNWLDAENRPFIYFSIEDTMEMLNCGHQKAGNIIRELDTVTGIGLIEKRRQGLGKPTVIYVKNFVVHDEEMTERTNSESRKSAFRKAESEISGKLKNGGLEASKSAANKKYFNDIEINNTESDHIASHVEEENRSDPKAETEVCSSSIKQNICYDMLLQRYPMEKDLVNGIYELILEIEMTQGNRILIASNSYPADLVKSKFMRLDSSHIEYVISCFLTNTTRVRNIKKYMLAALFNAPTTIGGYYTAEVNHDMYCVSGK